MSTVKERESRMNLALEGLSVGDAFGDRFFANPDVVVGLIHQRALPPEPWLYSDDTEMALAIAEVLSRHHHIDRDELARTFARRYTANPHRGYGGGAHSILGDIAQGVPWTIAADDVFDGEGSMGNGGAMRVAPLGAWFAEDELEVVVEQARASAEVTHMHPDGQAGAIAVAVAAAWAWKTRGDLSEGRRLIEVAWANTPEGWTRDAIHKALSVPLERSVAFAASILGNGSRIISLDTVPLCLWCAARHLDNYEEAMWSTVSALGDRDTTCAIVGGIVSLATGQEGIPAAWLAAREPLDRATPRSRAGR